MKAVFFILTLLLLQVLTQSGLHYVKEEYNNTNCAGIPRKFIAGPINVCFQSDANEYKLVIIDTLKSLLNATVCTGYGCTGTCEQFSIPIEGGLGNCTDSVISKVVNLNPNNPPYSLDVSIKFLTFRFLL